MEKIQPHSSLPPRPKEPLTGAGKRVPTNGFLRQFARRARLTEARTP